MTGLSPRSWLNGPPGATRIRKNETVTIANSVGMAVINRRSTYRSIDAPSKRRTDRSPRDAGAVRPLRTSVLADEACRMYVHDVVFETMKLRGHEIVEAVIKQRHDAEIAHRDTLRVGQLFHAVRWISIRRGGVYKTIEFFVRIERIVISGPCLAQLEEVVGILVIGDPAGAGDIKIAMLLEQPVVRLRVGVEQADLDAQRL